MWIQAVIGAVFVLVGGIWIGQGAGWIHGSFMTGEAVWLIIGVAVVLAGLWLLAGVRRARRRP
jgi:hypothetical protein